MVKTQPIKIIEIAFDDRRLVSRVKVSINTVMLSDGTPTSVKSTLLIEYPGVCYESTSPVIYNGKKTFAVLHFKNATKTSYVFVLENMGSFSITTDVNEQLSLLLRKHGLVIDSTNIAVNRIVGDLLHFLIRAKNEDLEVVVRFKNNNLSLLNIVK